MTIENSAKYNGQEADSFLQGMSDSVTKDTVWKVFNGNACISSYRRRRSCTG